MNCRRRHSEAVKRVGGAPRFIDLTADLDFDPGSPGFAELRLLWASPAGGMPPPDGLGKTLLVDYTDSLPAPGSEKHFDSAAATMWSLQLSKGNREIGDGALIVFSDSDLFEAAKALMTPEDLPDSRRMVAQHARISGADGIAARQLRVFGEAFDGLEAGAGLPVGVIPQTGNLPLGLIMRVPNEAEVATFISYVRNENVELDWLPEMQPMFYVAYQVTRDRERTFRSAGHLARWVMSPLGPDFTNDEIVHSVLGVLKAAEYTGVRWYCDPERAAWYGNLMLEWYGPAHDAYRPAFLSSSGRWTLPLRCKRIVPAPVMAQRAIHWRRGQLLRWRVLVR